MFWEIPTIDAKVNELVDILLFSGDATSKLIMTGDTKDARTFFAIKKLEQNQRLNENRLTI